MTNESKRQCLTRISTEHLPPFHPNGSPSGSKGSTSCSQWKVHTKQIKQHALAMVQHDDSIIDLRPDGSIFITPPNSYRLPNEIMILIFNSIADCQWTLYQCTLASKRCYDITNPMLWRAPEFEGCVFVKCMLGMTYQRRSALGQLIRTLHTTIFWRQDDLLGLLPHLPQLTHLHLTAPTSNKCVRLVPRYCPRLTSLSIDDIDLTKTAFTNLAKYCQLETFEWSTCSLKPPVASLALLRCPLRRLRLALQPGEFDTRLISAIQQFDQLTSLDISGYFYSLLRPLLTPSGFPQLTHLQFDSCNGLDDSTLVAFLKTHTQIERLVLEYPMSLTDTSLDAMCLLPRLNHVRLIGNGLFTSAAVRRLILACPLAHLDLHICHKVLAADFPELAVKHLPVLEQEALDKIRRASAMV